MSYLARLKAGISEKAVTVSTAKAVKRPYGSFDSRDSEHISENEGIESCVNDGLTADKSDTQTANAASTSPLPMEKSINDNCAELYNERAAIMEFDGGLSREDAEAVAGEATEKHRRECFERLEKAANAILSLPTRAMQNRELAKYCAGKSATACAEMRGWIAYRSRGRIE